MAQNNREKYAYLDQLSTRQLEELLLADAEDTSGQDTSEVILHILEVLQERDDGLAAEPVDVDRAWEEFLTCYNTPEGEGRSLYPSEEPTKAVPSVKKRFPALWRTARIAAATVALLFALMVGVQASGLDVFGVLAQWTSERLHFGKGQSIIQSENYQMFLNTLVENDIAKEIAPTWLPSGFIASEPVVESNDAMVSVKILFSSASGDDFSIRIARYASEAELLQGAFEITNNTVDPYISNNRKFYIFSNTDFVTASWADGVLSESVWGNISLSDVKKIVDSIGGS
jgi:hypothetical protein